MEALREDSTGKKFIPDHPVKQKLNHTPSGVKIKINTLFMRSMRNPPPHLKNSDRISHYVARVMISISIFSREQGGKDNFTTPPPLSVRVHSKYVTLKTSKRSDKNFTNDFKSYDSCGN